MSKAVKTRKYECEYYQLYAPETSCFFCQNCTDIFFDYTHRPYMFICSIGADTSEGLRGLCKKFIEDENQ